MFSKRYLSWALPKQNTPSPSSRLWCFSQPSSFSHMLSILSAWYPPVPSHRVLSALSLDVELHPAVVPFTCLAHQNPQYPYRPPSMLPALSSLKPSTPLISHRALAHSGIPPRSSKDAVCPSHLLISSQEKVFGSQEKAAGPSTAWSQTQVRTEFPLLFPCCGVDSPTSRAFSPLPLSSVKIGTYYNYRHPAFHETCLRLVRLSHKWLWRGERQGMAGKHKDGMNAGACFPWNPIHKFNRLTTW